MLKSRELWQEKVASCHGDGATSDEHIGDASVVETGLQVETAGAVDLHSLFKDGRLFAWDEAVLDEPADRTTRGRAGRGVLAAGPLHTSVPVCTGAGGGSGDAEKKSGAGGLEVGPGESLWDVQPARHIEGSERDDAERQAGRDGLGGVSGVEVTGSEAEGAREGLGTVGRAEAGIVLPHGCEVARER